MGFSATSPTARLGLVCTTVVLGLLLGAALPAAAAPTDTPNVTVNITPNPDHPERLTYTLTYQPNDVAELSTSARDNITITAVDGFEKQTYSNGYTAYEWDETTDTPSLTFTVNLSANTLNPDERYNMYFTDAPGTVAPLIPMNVHWIAAPGDDWQYRQMYSYGAQNVAYTRQSVTATAPTELTTGTSAVAYLGNATTYTTTTPTNGTIRLVVPDNVSLAAPPQEILASLANSSGVMGPERSPVTIIAVSDPAANRGGVSYRLGAWVDSDSQLNTSRNTWLHEYLHTQQYGSYGDEFEWWREGSVRYFTALETRRQGRISDTELDRTLFSTHESATLTDQSTWNRYTPYDQGAAVAAALDVELRNRSEGQVTLQTVSHRVEATDSPVTYTEFEEILEAQTDTEFDGWLTLHAASPQPPHPRTWRRLVPNSTILYTPALGLCTSHPSPYGRNQQIGDYSLAECPELAHDDWNTSATTTSYRSWSPPRYLYSLSGTLQQTPGGEVFIDVTAKYGS